MRSGSVYNWGKLKPQFARLRAEGSPRMQSERTLVERTRDRARHVRAIWFVLVSFTLAVAGYLWLGFDREQTIGYCVAAYIALNALNYRTMFLRPRK